MKRNTARLLVSEEMLSSAIDKNAVTNHIWEELMSMLDISKDTPRRFYEKTTTWDDEFDSWSCEIVCYTYEPKPLFVK